ncbi:MULTISPECIES: 23S rRNA (uracil(1939)-C(5))-methyltransferase RlmD [unclassified Neptuniibacter]|uniref:23S rRNA (uracil(1939)-C(5))-methyltransferase RlmD n=1 Tax=unclassified Neptuniibacter TaxID=2630693 RepID=UPI000C582C7F|nr:MULTISPECIES: 23S rRNA (uracil(1939)-C(5))-methyltransferase RlmD [unclassified Neptuniibacter]MAY42088.1 23S rRNA (uracil(1939)-C(5))-methyltransferase RlmD [Oceanospirillaceae bacterium]|tara:strand:- start:19997 stop:21352 length:1356 start_codon:yes stop_codon:yes gene_type:complete
MNRKKSLFNRPSKSKTKSSKKAIDYPEVIDVVGLSHEGRGIAKHEGKTLFISGALPEEQVRFELDAKHRRYDEATCTEIVTSSEHRVAPYCEYYGRCGGCDLQHLDHAEQITTKQTLVTEQLRRLGKFEPSSTEEPITSQSWNYRRSCRLGVNQLTRDGSAIVGFRRKGSSKLIKIEHCPILAEPLDKILNELPAVLETSGNFKEITHAEISMGDTEGALTLRVKKRPKDALAERLNQLAEKHNCRLYFDYGQHIEAFEAEAALSYKISDTATEIAFKPGDFIQVNARVNEKMISRALSWLQLDKDDRVLDLFCGIGNFTLPIASQVNRVVGIEGVEEMVDRARINASNNKLDNCEFYKANLTHDLRAMPWYKQGFNKILLDPPRTGALEIIKQLEQHAPDMVLYVSCNPAALARDGAELISQGYKVTKFCVMDMFPHTSHVESLALFERT